MDQAELLMLRAFARGTLVKQLYIADAVRNINNKQRILFDPNFIKDHRVRYADYYVDVNAQGEEAILSAGAEAFGVTNYLLYLPPSTSIIVDGNRVYYARK
ncbi:MAG: hypothetical protein 5 [Zeugodacus tau negev-like virus]|nr:MAG: hypothetical protein 5 [Zeugodacus tau negev-like virus]